MDPAAAQGMSSNEGGTIGERYAPIERKVSRDISVAVSVKNHCLDLTPSGTGDFSKDDIKILFIYIWSGNVEVVATWICSGELSDCGYPA